MADPPDSNYTQYPNLDPREITDSGHSDPLVISIANLANVAGNEAVVLKALLSSIERYSGAKNANDIQWALIHANHIKEYLNLLRSSCP